MAEVSITVISSISFSERDRVNSPSSSAKACTASPLKE